MKIAYRCNLMLIQGSILIALLLLSPMAVADPYVFPGPAVAPAPGTILPPPGSVSGKEFSHALDRDAAGVADPEQNVAWDGVGGVTDGNDYSGTRLSFPTEDQQVDAVANHGDILFDAVRADSSYLLFSVGNGVSPTGSGTFTTSEGETIGRAGDVSYETPGGTSKGVWAAGTTRIDRMTPLLDLDGLEIWGQEPPRFDSDRYSLLSDAAAGMVSIWNITGVPYVSQPTIVSAVEALLGPVPAVIDVDDIDLDALMVQDRDGEPDQFGGPGDSLIFSIRQLRDENDDDGFYATGSEIFTLDATAAGPPLPGFLVHGGHRWDHPYSLAAMRDGSSLRQLDVNAIEAASIPEPGAVVLALLALLGWGFCGWRCRVARR